MQRLNLWLKEISYIFLFVVIAAILSHFIGYFMPMVILILIYTLVRQAILLHHFEQWLSKGANSATAKIKTGVWGNIYYHFYRIKQKEKKRKKTLGTIIEQFRKSTDVLPDAAIVIGDHDEIEWSNKSAKLVLGVKKSDKGQRIYNLIRSPEFIDFLKSKNKKNSLTLPSPVNEKIILQYKIVAYANSKHLVIAHDVTQQQLMELMRKNFVDNISHELRTPLTVLKGYLETLQDMDNSHSAILASSLQKMDAQTDRMQYLVDDLLLLARLETKKTKVSCVNVAQLIKQICLEREQQRIKIDIDIELTILGEEQDLRSAFSNLINNALKYSESQSLVKVSWKRIGDKVIFEVADHGEGIAEKDIPRVTERFFRADIKRSKKLSGTGLGLAIVKHVLIRHDATLKITSQVGKGSQFKCIFPSSRHC